MILAGLLDTSSAIIEVEEYLREASRETLIKNELIESN